MTTIKTLFFSGIGGSGMSALAQVLKTQGHRILGSDRSNDQNRNAKVFDQLHAQQIELFPQDGTGVTADVDEVIVSSAVESAVPDVVIAKRSGIPVIKRADLLARIFNESDGIAVAGTSGKSTVTGMIGHILRCAGKNPTVINGGIMINYVAPPSLGNVVTGESASMVIEADESDGTLVGYKADIGVITNITLDHLPMKDLMKQFQRFADNSRSAVILNADCDQSKALVDTVDNRTTFSLERTDADLVVADIATNHGMTSFQIDGTAFRMSQPGRHNIANALAAIATCQRRGVSLSQCAQGLASFRGIRRRMEIVEEVNGITVIDDFGHNPEKIKATLETAKASWNRIFVMFQPHGFRPTFAAKDRFINVFTECLGADDGVVMPEIFYAGGTVERLISAADLISEISQRGVPAHFIPNREEIADWLANQPADGDAVIIMGARDNSLSELAHQVVARLKER